MAISRREFIQNALCIAASLLAMPVMDAAVLNAVNTVLAEPVRQRYGVDVAKGSARSYTLVLTDDGQLLEVVTHVSGIPLADVRDGIVTDTR